MKVLAEGAPWCGAIQASWAPNRSLIPFLLFFGRQVGTVMAEFPLDPQLSKMIVAAPEFKCSNEILR